MYHQIGMWDQKWVIGTGKERPTPKQQCTYAPLPCHANRRTRVNRPGCSDRLSVAMHNAMQIVLNNRILTCAQDVSRFQIMAAYTGEVSAEMLADIGTDIVLIGHPSAAFILARKTKLTPQNGKRPQRRPDSIVVRRRKFGRTRSR